MDQKTKTYTRGILGIALVVIIGAVGIVSYVNLQGQTQSQAATPQAIAQTPETAPTDEVAFTAQKGETILGQLEKTAVVITKDSAYGAYVDSINGLKSGTDGKYWTYYVDGKMANIGADAYITAGGEEVKWKLEKAE